MKKSVTIVSAALAGLLGFSSVAVAAPNWLYTPSKTAEALTKLSVLTDGDAGSTSEDLKGDDVAAHNPKADVLIVTSGDKYQDALELAEGWSASSVSTADMDKILAATESDTATAHEVLPLVLDDYDGGGLNFKAEFPTDYNYFLINHVGVLISVLDPETNTTTTYVVAGEITDQGLVLFHVNEDCAKAIDAGVAFMAIFSAE